MPLYGDLPSYVGQEEVVNDLRFRVEAEDKLIELQNVANVERKRARKEEKMREAEEARLREAAEVALIKQRQSRKQLTALGIHIDSPNGAQSINKSPPFDCLVGSDLLFSCIYAYMYVSQAHR